MSRRTTGELRNARIGDRNLLMDWSRGFLEDINDRASDISHVVDSALVDGRLWIWDVDNCPVSMAITAPMAEGVVRIRAVYTPPVNRGRGYATAGVASLTARLLADGNRCTLFTELANPTSNSIYQRIGYKAVQETLVYEFLH